MTIHGTSGNDNLVGTSGNDSFDMTQGGDDTVQGLGGNDVFSFGAAFTAADSVDGGTGTDTLKLAGDYSAGVTFGATTLVNVENIQLAAGFNYKLSTNDATVASGQTLSIDASALAEANNLFFDGSAETNGTFHVTGGLGNDTFTMGAHLTAADRFDGGGGDDTMFLGGDYNLAFGGSSIRDIGDMVLFGGHNYRFTTNDNNVSAGAVMNIDANSLTSGDTLNFNGTHETDGSFNLDAGAGQMNFSGGAQSDVFFMGGHLTAADRINGEGGSDVVYLGGNYNLAMGKPTLTSIENVHLQGGFNYHITSGGGIATDATQVWDATSLTASDTLSLNFVKETAGSVIVDGGAAATSIAGTQQGDDFDFSVTGQGGLTASDTINGEGGYDRVQLGGDYTGSHALALTNTTIKSIEEFDFDPGHSYQVTLAEFSVHDGTSMTIDDHLLGPGDALTFDGSLARPSTTLNFIGGAGDDVLTAGMGNDTFAFGANFTAADQIDGGAGSDTVAIDGYYMGGTALVFSPTTMVNVEQLVLGNSDPSFCYDITTADATVAAGATMTIDGANLTSSQSLTFNGSAESDGHFFIEGGADRDTFTGGALQDTFYYSTAIAVDGAARDTINAFDFANDRIEFAAVSAIAAAVNGGTVNEATIDANLTSLLTAARLPAHEAVLFTPKTGDLAGHVFLVIDGNGTAGYQTGADLVIELSGALHTTAVSTANFFG